MIFEPYSFPDRYDASIELAVGRFILLCGQIDRLLIEAIKTKSKQNLDTKKAIGIVRGHRKGQGMMLGDWLQWLETCVKEHSIDAEWAKEVADYIRLIKPTRDRIAHDSLMLSMGDSLEWKTNQSKRENNGEKRRDHKPFEMSELTSALDSIYKFRNFIIDPNPAAEREPDCR